MNIAILGNAGSSHIAKWANAFALRGHNVTVYSFSQHEHSEETYAPTVKRRTIGAFSKTGIFGCVRRLRSFFKQEKPDVIHVFYATVYALAARLVGAKPLIVTVMGSDVYAFPERGFFARQLLRFNLRGCAAISSASHVMKERTALYTSRPIEVIPFGVDIGRFFPAPEQSGGGEIVRVAFVKLFKPVYAPRDMLTAFCLLKESLRLSRHPMAERVKLEMYGGGELEAELKKQAAACDFTTDITFHGYIENSRLPDALRASDIFCATSLRESFGVSLVEAMACGLPVICSDADGFKEIVTEETGIIAPAGNPAAIASGLRRLITDEALRHTMGQNGRRRVEKLYDFEQNVGQMLKIYQDLQKS